MLSVSSYVCVFLRKRKRENERARASNLPYDSAMLCLCSVEGLLRVGCGSSVSKASLYKTSTEVDE